MLFLYVAQFNDTTKELFSKFYDNYLPLVLFIVDKKIPESHKHLREDCVQEVWLECANCFESIQKVAVEEQDKYVSGIIRNVCSDFFNREITKQEHRETDFSSEMEESIRDLGSSLDFLEAETHEDVIRALNLLPGNMRATLELKYYRNKTVAEISTILDISTHAVYKRLERGLAELVAILVKEGGYGI